MRLTVVSNKQCLKSTGYAVILAVNAGMNVVMKKLAAIEKHHSITALQNSISLRIFMAQFFNTALVLLFVGSSMSSKAHNGDIDFTPAW